MRRPPLFIGLAVAAALCLQGCYGPFILTRKLYTWNGQVSKDKWAVEAVFVLCAWLPVYGIAIASDALFFNSVEFLTGKNPLAVPPK